MARYFPHPLLLALLTLMWLLLTRFSLGNLILGLAVASIASRAMAALDPAKPRIRRWRAIPVLAWRMIVDILRSNASVAAAIVTGRARRPGFVEMPLELRDRNALAILAIVITATPGTAWVEYRVKSGILRLHVFDEDHEGQWSEVIKTRYEPLLMEIFE